MRSERFLGHGEDGGSLTGLSGRIEGVLISQAAGIELTYAREMSGDSTVLKLPGRMNAESVRAITTKLAALGVSS